MNVSLQNQRPSFVAQNQLQMQQQQQQLQPYYPPQKRVLLPSNYNQAESSSQLLQQCQQTPASIDDLNELIRIFKKRQLHYLSLLDFFRKRKDFEVNYKEQLSFYASYKTQETARLPEELAMIRRFTGVKISDPKQKMVVTRFCMRSCEMHEESSMKLVNLLAFDSSKEKSLNSFKELLQRLLSVDSIDLESILILLASRFARTMFEELERVRLAVLQDANLMLILMDSVEEEEEIYVNGYLVYEKPLHESIYPPGCHDTRPRLVHQQYQIQISLSDRLEQQRKLFHFYAKSFFKLYDILSLDKQFMREGVAELRVGKEEKTYNDLQAKNTRIQASLKLYIQTSQSRKTNASQSTKHQQRINQADEACSNDPQKQNRQMQMRKLLQVDFFMPICSSSSSSSTSSSSPLKSLPTHLKDSQKTLTSNSTTTNQQQQQKRNAGAIIKSTSTKQLPISFHEIIPTKLNQLTPRLDQQQQQQQQHQQMQTKTSQEQNQTTTTITVTAAPESSHDGLGVANFYPSNINLVPVITAASSPYSQQSSCKGLMNGGANSSSSSSSSYQTELEQFVTSTAPIVRRKQQLQGHWKAGLLEDPKQQSYLFPLSSNSKSPMRITSKQKLCTVSNLDEYMIQTIDKKSTAPVSSRLGANNRAQSNPRSAQKEDTINSAYEFDDLHATLTFSKNCNRFSEHHDSDSKQLHSRKISSNQGSSFLIKIRSQKTDHYTDIQQTHLESSIQHPSDFTSCSGGSKLVRPAHPDYHSNLISKHTINVAPEFEDNTNNGSALINRNPLSRLAHTIFRRPPKQQQHCKTQQTSYSQQSRINPSTNKNTSDQLICENGRQAMSQLSNCVNPVFPLAQSSHNYNNRITSQSVHQHSTINSEFTGSRQNALKLTQHKESSENNSSFSISIGNKHTATHSANRNHVMNPLEQPHKIQWSVQAAAESFAKRYLTIKSSAAATVIAGTTSTISKEDKVPPQQQQTQQQDENQSVSYVQLQVTQFPLGYVNQLQQKQQQRRKKKKKNIDMEPIGFHEKSLKMRKLKTQQLPSIQTLSTHAEDPYYDL